MQIKNILVTIAAAMTASVAFAQTPPNDAPPPMNHAPGVLDHAPDFKGPPPTLERTGGPMHREFGHRPFPDPEVHALIKKSEMEWNKLDADKAAGAKSAVAADKEALLDTLGKLHEKHKEFVREHGHERHEGRDGPPPGFGVPGGPGAHGASGQQLE